MRQIFILDKMKTAPWVIVIILLLIIIFQRECHRCPVADPCPEPDTIRTVKIVKGDSIPHELPVVLVPDPDSIKAQPVPAGIDSAAVAAAYFSKVYGYVKMVDDSSLYVGFRYLVEENKLRWVIPKIANRKTTAYYFNTTYVYKNPPKLKLFAGIGVGRSLNSFALAPSLALITKKDHLYSIHYDVINRDVYFSIYWKISKR